MEEGIVIVLAVVMLVVVVLFLLVMLVVAVFLLLLSLVVAVLRVLSVSPLLMMMPLFLDRPVLAFLLLLVLASVHANKLS